MALCYRGAILAMLKVIVVIPVGPGHDDVALAAQASVVQTWAQSHGPFGEMQVALAPDHDGLLGRSAARNKGMEENPADWHFLLDADDTMCPYAFAMVDLRVDATFGTVYRAGRPVKGNRAVVNLRILRLFGARGTLSMGCFVRGDLGLRFDEELDVGEDFDFYLRLTSFTKRREPLVNIGTGPSAGGPRSSERCDWWQECDKVVARYV